MNPEITEALAVVAELAAEGIWIYVGNDSHDLHLTDRYYPSPELWQRWEASKATIVGLLGWGLHLRMPEWDRENEYNDHLTILVDVDTPFPRLWQPRN